MAGKAEKRTAKKQRHVAARAQRVAHDCTLVKVCCEACGREQFNYVGACACGHGWAVYA